MPGSQDWGNPKVCVFCAVYSYCFLPSLHLPGNFPLHQFLFVTDVTDTVRLSLLLETPSPAITPFSWELPADTFILPSITLQPWPAAFHPRLCGWDTALPEQAAQ